MMKNLVENLFMLALLALIFTGLATVAVQFAGIVFLNGAWALWAKSTLQTSAITCSALVALISFTYPYAARKRVSSEEEE